MFHTQRQPHRGVVLLVVLGMLSLFSVLVVSYVVFSSQMSDTSFATSQKRLTEILPERTLDNALVSLIVGTNDPKSAVFGHSLMEDLWGTDGLGLRVGHRRQGASSGTSMPPSARGMLLRPLSAGKPQTTLFKFPTSIQLWHNDGSSPPGGPALSTIPSTLRVNYDDIFAGRLVTFVEGPLYGVTFRVIRSFGRGNAGSNEEASLAGCLVIDLSEMPTEELSIDGSTEALYVTAGIHPNRLLYNAGNDERPGRAGFDDDGNSVVDDFTELGYPGSDDIGYRFVINGRAFNGLGQNPSGLTGVTRAGTTIDSRAHIELQPNARLIGTQAAGGNGGTFAYPSPDEQWDAADLENWFLAWQPSDHRRAVAQIHSGVSGAELNRQLGQHIIPSFHRPSVINYLMNAPIRLPGDAAGFDRTFAEMETGFDTAAPNRDDVRLIALIRRLRRATMRPLNFGHLYFNASASDLNGDGNPYDGAPGFSGSNPTPILSETIQTDPSVAPALLMQKVKELAYWLVNGPWDVDNDNDGIPDSLWTDFNLAPVQSPDGRWIKPMIAMLVEDADGKINVNVAGNYNQLLTRKFRSTNLPTYTNSIQYFDVIGSLGVFGRGGGVGPAEIDFSHLFDEGTAVSPPFNGPQFHTQTTNPISNVLLTRYGNLLNMRYGGQAYNYVPSYPPAAFTKYPGQGDVANPDVNADLLARIPFPSRTPSQLGFGAMGQPVDLSGRSQMRIDRRGNRRFDNMDSTQNPNGRNEVVNQPYEGGMDGTRGDDKPFTPNELHDLLNGGELAGRLSQLLGDAADANESLRRLLTTESRSLDVPEVVGAHDILHLVEGKITAANKQIHLDRMLAVELRKGSKLNLNRPLGNGTNDAALGANNLTDETFETETQLITTPVLPNEANNRRSRETAFPQISGEYPAQANAWARYAATTLNQDDFNGIDRDGDGVLDIGDDRDMDGIPDKIATGNELLARHLYCLMFSLIADTSNAVWVEDFPYPNNFTNTPAIRNRYAARRIAQWAANAVDYRDTDVRCTRLRYDPNPFNGFDLGVAQRTVVWGMERPEVEITETVAFHDKRLKRNLPKEPDMADPTVTLDGELPIDEDPDPTDMKDPDKDMDSFRIPEPSAFVELHNLRSPVVNLGQGQPSFPTELYTNVGGTPRLDLGRVVGTGNLRSPVYRLAVGQPTRGRRGRSTRWVFDAERVGRDLVATQGRDEELDYLTTPNIDYTDAAVVNTEVDTWNEATRHAAEVRHSLSANNEYVTIADDDFDPTNDGGSPHRIRLQRFVWFAKLRPTNTMNVISNAASGMRLGNVFYNKNDPVNGGDVTDPDNASPTLGPGQYAMIAPRAETRFGQTSASTGPTYPYRPVDHRLEFLHHPVAPVPNPRVFRFNMRDFADTVKTPRYEEDDPSAYDVESVVPILCQSLYPHEVVARADWATYLGNNPADEVVDMGFNISAPDSGGAYYLAPTHRISAAAGASYPLVDGYHDYDDPMPNGFHPDTPLDHVAGTPMESNGWNGVGTHQEARTVFLQRLADPTSPWHPIDNPYLTMDLMPIDLTTINGEYDVREEIDRDGDGNDDDLVDNRTTWVTGPTGPPVPPGPGGVPGGGVPPGHVNRTGRFSPELKFDTRRKIPDLTRDRGLTVLLPNINSPASLTDYDRVIVAKRSPLSASFSVLRETREITGADAYWRFSLGSMWNNGNAEAFTTNPPPVGIDTTYKENQDFDNVRTSFFQSLGFVNREYGQPLRSNSPRVQSLGTGTPDEVYFTAVPWLDREFQSPLDLINVPAVSRTGLLPQFSPGTLLQDNARREIPIHFDHLLGFEANYAKYRAADESSLDDAGPHSTNADDLTGERAGLEQIFDFVDIGPVWFDSRRWLEPNQVSYLQDDPMNPLGLRDRIFNRVVETLQPPFNFIDRHRTPGRVNLNTTPDYIRRGPTFTTTFQPTAPATDPDLADRFLDAGEGPATPTTTNPSSNPPTNVGRVFYNPNNSTNNGEGFSSQFRSSPLYGNGSVHRALTWGISTAYELDDEVGSPTTMGDFNDYERTVDTRFGRSFKAFIESRRGYSKATQVNILFQNPTTPPPIPINPALRSLGNPMLDWRYPTQFAGVFAPAQASSVPSVQRFMRTESKKNNLTGVRRRTHDMSLLRPHPDFDLRTMTDSDRNDLGMTTDASYSLRVENPNDPNGVFASQTPPSSLRIPNPATTPQEVVNLRMPMVNTGLFERPQAELHENFRNLDRDSFFRFQNAARLSNVTTHHSNVFVVRMTLSYFVIDPTTGSPSGEYVTDTGNTLRSKAHYIIDRSIPIAFLRGLDVNALNTVIYSSIEE